MTLVMVVYSPTGGEGGGPREAAAALREAAEAGREVARAEVWFLSLNILSPHKNFTF